MKERNSKEFSKEDRMAIRFIVDVIEEALKRYDISFNTLDEIFKKMGYWEIFNDNKATLALTHCGMEEIFKKIERAKLLNFTNLRLRDLNSQSATVIEQLILNGKSKEEASSLWFNSKTKKILEDNKMFWVSGMRCFVELEYELEGNPKWMNEPFE